MFTCPTRAETDETYMRLAIRLAKRAEGLTSPNPIVGAVLVKDNKIIGKGYHKRAGLPHAEIEAIKNAKKKGFSPEGATLYVTLEPCSTYGRTPPCVEAIIRKKLKELSQE
jgi:diaminohydroxyphosphoribosylaminopyrimidine deaminase/5-amino-6-(5-phosphoribosylamino)uracil reductase